MKVADLELIAIQQALASEGIVLIIGPFAVRIQSQLKSIAEGIATLYKHYPVAPLDQDNYADFQIRLFTPRGIRAWFKPQVLFSNDDHIPFKPLPLNQAFAFLEWGLNWCIAQHSHNHLILHAAVVEKNGNAAIMPAAPGAGKSTLCATLINSGWRLLSDEMALVNLSDGLLTPIPRPVSLKNESIEIIKNFSPQSFISQPTYDTNKGTVAHLRAPDSSLDKVNERVSATWIIAPQYQQGAIASLEQESKAQSTMMAVQNSFNYNVLGADGFNALVKLVDQCGCYTFRYCRLNDAVDIFDTLLAKT